MGFRVGYKVALVKANRDFNLEGALAKIRKTAPTAEVEEEKQQEVVIALRTLKSKGFAAMFKALEQSSQKLGIASIGVTVASMKDVYIKINMDWAPGGQEREEAVDDKDIAGVCVEVAKSPTARRRFWALLVKRTIYLMRSWGIITMGLVIPIALQLLITQFAKMPSPSTFRGREENGRASIELKLGAHFPGSTIFLEEASSTSSARLISNAFGGLVKEEHGYVQVIRNTSEELAKMARKDFGLYIRTYPMAVVLEKDL
ncbi:phospholipid-transporting ATPase ABCA3-like [Haemaphysalis longicornis]